MPTKPNIEDQAILGPNELPNPKYHPMAARSEPKISHRDFFVLSLHLSGYTGEEIAELAGYSGPYSVYNILRKKEVILVRQQLLESLELEFEALQKGVFEVVKTKLKSNDERVQLEAVQIWMKYFQKFTPKEDKEKQLTAEDIVKQLLQVNIQVNVGQDAK